MVMYQVYRLLITLIKKKKLLKGVSICFYLYMSHRHKIKEEVFLLEIIWQECVSHKEKAMMFQIKKHVHFRHLPPRT